MPVHAVLHQKQFNAMTSELLLVKRVQQAARLHLERAHRRLDLHPRRLHARQLNLLLLLCLVVLLGDHRTS